MFVEGQSESVVDEFAVVKRHGDEAPHEPEVMKMIRIHTRSGVYLEEEEVEEEEEEEEEEDEDEEEENKTMRS